ncbi:MAG: antibiotic biosynthesis monooxygenase family protein [Longimicrobiales bacterium]
MIARVWTGRTRTEDADTYAAYLARTGIPDYHATPGNRGVHVLRRIDGEVTEFLLLTYWDDIASIRAFAGADIERARYYPEDEHWLLEMPETVTHYDVLAQGDPA